MGTTALVGNNNVLYPNNGQSIRIPNSNGQTLNIPPLVHVPPQNGNIWDDPYICQEKPMKYDWETGKMVPVLDDITKTPGICWMA